MRSTVGLTSPHMQATQLLQHHLKVWLGFSYETSKHEKKMLKCLDSSPSPFPISVCLVMR